MSFTVVYDACVLYPARVRNILMQIAVSELVKAKWTREIEREWISNLLEKRPDLTLDKLNKTAALMERVVPDCIVENYESLTEVLELPDPNDRHVLAVAIHCDAQVIVTFNTKDFPSEALMPYNIEAVHPDTFLINQYDLSNVEVIKAVKAIRGRLRKPKLSAEAYLESLELTNLPGFSDLLSDSIDLI